MEWRGSEGLMGGSQSPGSQPIYYPHSFLIGDCYRVAIRSNESKAM